MTAKPFLLVLLMLALGLKPFPPSSAAAQDAGACLYQCEGSVCYDFGNHTSLCQETRAKCQARCSGKKLWGAIAYSKSDKAFGWSIEQNVEADAKKAALAKCIANGGAGCQVWVKFENECGAVAADGNIATWGTAAVQATAQQRAILECKKAGGKNCTIAAWACSKM
jgi:Domain of unknown function (DUF4189)